MKRYAIYGAGSLGTVLGAFITQKGGKIDLINRNKAHIEALRKNGAVINGTVDMTVPVSALTPDEMSGKYNVILLMTKQLLNKEVVTFLKDYLSDDGVIVTLQNGLPEPLIAEIVGSARTMGCVVEWGAALTAPGVCTLTSEVDSLSFHMGKMDGISDETFNEVKELLEHMGTVDVEENFIGTRWSKLLINAAFSGMSAVLGCTFGEAAGPKESRRVVQKLIKECIDVCRAGGIRIEPVQGKDIVRLLDYSNPLKRAFAFMIIPVAIRKHAKLKASMLQDIEKGKLTEVDAINGAVSDYGRMVGCPTPMNDKVVEIIHRIEKGELKPGFDNLSLFV